jgi:peptidoglycan-associated lipoprotein
MMKVFLKWFVFGVVAASLAVMTGCKKNDAGAEFYGSEANMIGDPLMGDTPLIDPAGLPADGNRNLFAPVYFAYDSSQVNPEEAGKVEDVAAALKRGKHSGVIVEGHADERGSREYNLALGERRALAVRDYLISLGADPAAIQTKSYGEEQPADMGHDEAAWRKNRRAVFAIY